MEIGLFLGAGASVPFGMLTTEGLRNKLRRFTQDDLDEEVLQSFLTNPKYLDIEYVLQAVGDIIKFSRSRGGDYFFTRGTGSLRFEKGMMDFDKFIKRVIQVQIELEEFVYENYRWKPAYMDKVLELYDVIFKFLNEKSNSIKIFTTNYDRIIEEYCRQRVNYDLVDGFEREPPASEYAEWSERFQHDNNSDYKPVFLYKLHGSLNWKEHVDVGIVKTNEEAISSDSNYRRNLVVMPTLSPKEEEDVEPYQTIISEFVDYMSIADACIVIGFSFRDSRINDVFTNFIHRGKPLIVISPSSMKNVCQNLLEVAIPKDFDEHKASYPAPVDGHVWCIPDIVENRNNLENDLNAIAWAHIQKAHEKKE